MSAETENTAEQKSTNEGVKLNGLFAFKLGMSTLYEDGQAIAVTVLKYRPWVISQMKTEGKDGYSAIQLACGSKRASNTTAAQKGHLNKAGFENSAEFVREYRGELPEGIEVGKKVDINSLVKGDKIKVTAKSKGRGFAGVMKRYDFGGGRASHGSGTHRRPGSIGNCKEPSRVMPGRKMPGRYGYVNITTKNLKVVDVDLEESVLYVSGSVPGSRNTLVRLMKV